MNFPYEDNRIVGLSVLSLVFVGFIVPVAVVSFYGVPSMGPNSYFPAPPSTFDVLGNGTSLDILVNETAGPVALPSDPFVIDDNKIFAPKMNYSGMIAIDEPTAISLTSDFLSHFEYLDGQVLNLSVNQFSSSYWTIYSPLEGGSLTVWINALTGVVVFYSLDVDLRLPGQNDLRDYFSTPGNLTLEEAESSVISFLSKFNYSLVNNSYYRTPWYRPLPPGDIAEGFVNGEFYFQIFGILEGAYERNNKVHLQVEASTGQVVYFSYLWTEYHELPDVDLISAEDAATAALDYFDSDGPTVRYTHLVISRYWNTSSDYEDIVLYEVGISNSDIVGIYVNPLDGERLLFASIVYLEWAYPLPTITTGAASPLSGWWMVAVLPLMSFSFGASGYIILKNRIANRAIDQ